jgi:hypothetical protein
LVVLDEVGVAGSWRSDHDDIDEQPRRLFLVLVVCVRLVLVARLARCALGVLCGLGRVLSVVGGLGPVCIGFCPIST